MHFGSETIDLTSMTFIPELVGCIPARVARRYRVVPVQDSPTALSVALADPNDIATVDILSHLLHRDIVVRVATVSQLNEFIERLYGDTKDD